MLALAFWHFKCVCNTDCVCGGLYQHRKKNVPSPYSHSSTSVIL